MFSNLFVSKPEFSSFGNILFLSFVNSVLIPEDILPKLIVSSMSISGVE